MGTLAVTRFPLETVVIRVPGHEDIVVTFVKMRLQTGKRAQATLSIRASEEIRIIRGEKVAGWRDRAEGVA
jgi:hypothetical protein